MVTVWRTSRWTSGNHRAVLRAALIGGLLALTGVARADREACLQAHEQGQLSRLHQRFADARAHFMRCMQPSCPRLIRDDCASLLGQLDAGRVRVVFGAQDAKGEALSAVRVYVDGALVTETLDGRAQPLDPGVHTVRFEAAGLKPHEQQLVLRENERDRALRVQLGGERAVDGPASSRGAIRATAALGGAALAALATGIGLAVSGKRELDHLDDVCGDERDCGDAATDKGRTMYIGADVCFGLAGALAVSAASVFLIDRYRDGTDRAARPSITAQISPRAAGVSVSARF